MPAPAPRLIEMETSMVFNSNAGVRTRSIIALFSAATYEIVKSLSKSAPNCCIPLKAEVIAVSIEFLVWIVDASPINF